MRAIKEGSGITSRQDIDWRKNLGLDRHCVERDGFRGKRMDGGEEGEGEGEKMRWIFVGAVGIMIIQHGIQTGRRAKFVPKWFVLLIVYLLIVLEVICLDYI